MFQLNHCGKKRTGIHQADHLYRFVQHSNDNLSRSTTVTFYLLVSLSYTHFYHDRVSNTLNQCSNRREMEKKNRKQHALPKC